MKIFQKNEPLSALTHLLATLFSVAGLILMAVFATMQGSATHVVGSVIFGTSLILLYCTSTIYHFSSRKTKLKNIFRRIDHAMIFVLIAGTYTPIALIMPQRGGGWSLFGIVWGLAIIGVVLKGIGIKMSGWLTVAIYITMGWLALFAIQPLAQWLTIEALSWLFIGGILYTVGCVFFALDKIIPRTRWLGMHEVFHVFVMAGSFSHFWLMIKYVL
jgi:hemolysin III